MKNLSIELCTPEFWNDYELLDCGNFEKLERFGSFIFRRPEPQAVWDKAWTEQEWQKQAHARFEGDSPTTGKWIKYKPVPDRWEIRYHSKLLDFKMRLATTAFKHVGLFPEQATNWEFIADSIKKIKGEEPKVLNLFAYTGGASIAARNAGAFTTHVDSIKQVVTWANENAELNNFDKIRWMVEDAVKFVKREIRRGNTYHGIILDPPAYGHGPKGEKWKLEDHILEMMKDVTQLLDPKQHFLVLNTYSLGFSSLIVKNLLDQTMHKDAKKMIGEVVLQAKSGVILPLGVVGRVSKNL
ncbi:oxidoreductase [bacterium]|nr:MAG: oxidoreductase [bacterium]